MSGENLIDKLSKEEAQKYLLSKGVDVQDNHDLLLKSLNEAELSLLICKEPDIKLNRIPTGIVYIEPDFLKDPKTQDLKARKYDINLYLKSFEDFDKQMNNFVNKTKQSFKNLVNPLNILRDEICKVLKNFINTIKNLCTPIINENMGLQSININYLSESKVKEFLTEKEKILNIINDFFIESKQLNSNYNEEFNPIKDEIESINKAISNLPEPINSLIEDNEKAKEKFERILDHMNENTGSIHKELTSVKRSLTSSIERKKSIIKETENDSSKLKQIYEEKKLIAHSLMKEIDENIKSLTSKSEQIRKSITQIREKYEQDIVELQTMDLQIIDINKTKDFIYETYEPIIDEQKQLKNMLKENCPHEELIKETSLDLLYIMDITGSMDSYVENTKKELINVMDAIIKTFNGIDINLGYIGYKDFEEHSNNMNIINEKFEKDILKIKNKIEEVEVGGGDDIAEDIQWAFENALKNEWTSYARIAILACDAPCHGKKYHTEEVSDNYPDGIEGRRDIEDLITELCDKNIWLFCVKITDDTEIMYNMFKAIYNKNGKGNQFLTSELKNPDDLSRKIIEKCKLVYEQGRVNLKNNSE